MALRGRRLLVQFSAAVLGAFGGGCADSTDPFGGTETYSLVRVVDDPLPAVLYRNESGAGLVLSDTIRLRADGTGTHSGVHEWVGEYPQEPTWGSTEIRYRRVGSHIEIDHVCPADADCVPPPHLIGQQVVGGLRLRWAPQLSGRSPMLYRRVEDDS